MLVSLALNTIADQIGVVGIEYLRLIRLAGILSVRVRASAAFCVWSHHQADFTLPPGVDV
jgi:hypothetical protein